MHNPKPIIGNPPGPRSTMVHSQVYEGAETGKIRQLPPGHTPLHPHISHHPNLQVIHHVPIPQHYSIGRRHISYFSGEKRGMDTILKTIVSCIGYVKGTPLAILQSVIL